MIRFHTYLGTLLLLPNFIFARGTVAFRMLFGCAEVNNGILEDSFVVSPRSPFCLERLVKFVVFGRELGQLLLSGIEFFLNSVVLRLVIRQLYPQC